MKEINKAEQEQYLQEMAIRLRTASVTPGAMKDGSLPVEYDGAYLCRVSGKGDVFYRDVDTESETRSAALHRVIDMASEISEYMRLMESAPHLEASGLDGDYRILADFGNAVLAGHPTKYGVQFITWEWSYDHTSVWQGHYHEQDYAGAKRDFALRAGLVGREELFSPEQLAEVYRAIHETLDGKYAITDERRKLLESAAVQIEQSVPDLERRTNQSNQRELELSKGYQSQTQIMY